MRLDAYMQVTGVGYIPNYELEILSYRQHIIRPWSIAQGKGADVEIKAQSIGLTVLRVVDEATGGFLKLAHDKERLVGKLKLVLLSHGDLSKANSKDKLSPANYSSLEIEGARLHRIRIWGNPRFHALAASLWLESMALRSHRLGPVEELQFEFTGESKVSFKAET